MYILVIWQANISPLLRVPLPALAVMEEKEQIGQKLQSVESQKTAK